MRILLTSLVVFISTALMADDVLWFLDEPVKKPPVRPNLPPDVTLPLPIPNTVNEQVSPLPRKNTNKIDQTNIPAKTYKKVDARRAGPSLDAIKGSYNRLTLGNIWTDGFDNLNHRGERFLDYVKTVGKHGLKPGEYHLDDINSALVSDGDVEKLVSRAFVKLVNHATLGRLIPKKADTEWYIGQSGINQDSALKSAAESSDIVSYIEGLFPQMGLYRRLVRAYSDIDEQAAAGGWSDFPTAGPKLQLGSRHKHVSLLRKRLSDSGHLDNAIGGNTFDTGLEVALARFQADHGLNDDGVLGRFTRLTLSKSASQRKTQIATTLERLRWLPKNLGNRYIMVNTAGYELNLVENDYSSVNMRIVVGKKRHGENNHETPSFSKDMRYLVLNPKWYVPDSIASKELLAMAKKDSNFFKNKGYRVYDAKGEVNSSKINWHKYSKDEKLPLQIVQNAGNDNALGKIKFMLPNKFNIYLHDTPEVKLFKRDRRAFSHGCVRLSDPITLATRVLGRSEGEISQMIATGENQQVDLAQNIPVYIVYLTAWVRDDGSVIFFDDYYGRDKRMRHNFS